MLPKSQYDDDQTPLGELTALPRPIAGLEGGAVSGPSLPVPVELVSGDVFIVAPEYVDAPEC